MANPTTIGQATAKHQARTMWQAKVKRMIFSLMALGTMMTLGCTNPSQPQSAVVTQPPEAAEHSPHGHLPYTHYFIATWKGTDIPAVNMRYQILNSSGQVVMEGRTNDKGETGISESLLPDGLSIQLFGD